MHPLPRHDVALDPAAADDRLGANIALDDGMLAQNDGSARADFPLHRPVDADRTLESQAPLELEPAREEGEGLPPAKRQLRFLAVQSEHAAARGPSIRPREPVPRRPVEAASPSPARALLPTP